MYTKASPSSSLCTCNHDFEFHSKGNLDDDIDAQEGLLNQGVEMQKLKSSMQSFDKSASKISHWFDRNRYVIKNMKEGIERYSDYGSPSSQSSLILEEKRLKKMLEPRLQSSKEHKKRCPVCTNAYGSLPGVASKLHI